MGNVLEKSGSEWDTGSYSILSRELVTHFILPRREQLRLREVSALRKKRNRMKNSDTLRPSL